MTGIDWLIFPLLAIFYLAVYLVHRACQSLDKRFPTPSSSWSGSTSRKLDAEIALLNLALRMKQHPTKVKVEVVKPNQISGREA